jgi:hypothetical protein
METKSKNIETETANITGRVNDSDPVFKLISKISLQFTRIFLFFFFFNPVFYFLLAFFSNHLHNTKIPTLEPGIIGYLFRNPINHSIVSGNLTVIGFFENLGDFYLIFVSQPAIIASLVWFPFAITTIIKSFQFKSLINNHLFNESITFEDEIERLTNQISNRRFSIILLGGLIVANATYFFPANIDPSSIAISWRQALPPFFKILEMIHADLIFYSILMVAYRGIVFTMWLRRLFFNFEIEVKSIESDEVGGFGELGSYLLKIGNIILVIGISLLIPMATSPASWLSFPPTMTFAGGLEESFLSRGPTTFGFLVFAPLAFVGPLMAAHGAMGRYKKKVIDDAGSTYQEIQQILPKIKPNSNEKKLDRFNSYSSALDNINTHVVNMKKLPEWPIQIRQGIGGAFSTFSPLVLALAPDTSPIIIEGLSLFF